MIVATMKSKKKSAFCAKLFKAFRVVLVALFGVQATLLYLAQRNVELPDYACAWLAEKFAPAGTRLEISGGTLRRLAFLEFRQVALFHKNGTEPIVSLRTAGAYFNWKNIINPNKNVQTFFADGIELRCPASLSQTGKAEKVLSDGRINAAFSFGEIYLKDAVAYVGNIALYAAGNFNISLFREPDATAFQEDDLPAPETSVPVQHENPEILAPVLKFAGTLSAINHQIEKIDTRKNISLQIAVEPAEDEKLDAHIQLFCESLQNREPNIFVNELYIHGIFAWDPKEQILRQRIPLRASGKTVSYAVKEGELLDAWSFSAEDVDVAVALSFSEHFDVSPQEIAVSALRIKAENFLQGSFELSPTLVELDAIKLNEMSASLVLNTQAFGSSIAAETSFSPSEALNIIINAEPDIQQLLKIPQISAILPADIAKLGFSENPDLRADVLFDRDFNFVRTDYVLDTGAIKWDTLNASSFHCSGSFTQDELDVALARACGERYCTNARVFFELNPHGKYRVQVFGTAVNPEVLDDYFGWFWWRIWNNLSIPKTGPAPRIDLDVHGTLDPNSRWEYIYGAIAGENAVSGGILVDKVSLRIAEEPTVIAAFDMNILRGDNRVAGSLQWHYALNPEYHFRDFRFEFAGSMPPSDVFNIVGEGLPEIFDGILVREDSGTALARGYMSGDEHFYPQERLLVEVDVSAAPGPFSFFGIEASDFVGKINYDSGNVRVSPFSAKCGKGNVSGEILVCFPPEFETEGTRVGLDIKIGSMPISELSETLDKLMSFGDKSEIAAEADKPAQEKHEDLSEVTTQFKGELTLPNIESLKADGALILHDPKLFNLRILGGFSRFLEMLKISLTSFELTDAETDFTVENGKVYLPNLKIYGESGELDVQLNAELKTKELNGSAVFKNRRFTQIPILGKFVDWASETTTLVPIGISGTLDDIKWSLKPFSNFNPNKVNHGEAPSSRETGQKQ